MKKRNWEWSYLIRIGSCISAVLMLGVLIGCGKAAPPPPAQYLGEWVVVGDAIGRGDTGRLRLDANGKFDAEYTTSSGDGQFAKDPKVEKQKRAEKNKPEFYSGTYTVSREKIGAENVTTLTFTILKPPGNASQPAFLLMYDPGNEMLFSLTVGYARPGKEAQARKVMERR